MFSRRRRKIIKLYIIFNSYLLRLLLLYLSFYPHHMILSKMLAKHFPFFQLLHFFLHLMLLSTEDRHLPHCKVFHHLYYYWPICLPTKNYFELRLNYRYQNYYWHKNILNILKGSVLLFDLNVIDNKICFGLICFIVDAFGINCCNGTQFHYGWYW